MKIATYKKGRSPSDISFFNPVYGLTTLDWDWDWLFLEKQNMNGIF